MNYELQCPARELSNDKPSCILYNKECYGRRNCKVYLDYLESVFSKSTIKRINFGESEEQKTERIGKEGLKLAILNK